MASPNDESASKERLIAIGNFDGVHRGHAHLLGQMVRAAKERTIAPTALTFHPHPAEVLGRGAPLTLTRLERKLELLKLERPELAVIVQPFDVALSQSSPREFAELLTTRYGARFVVVGENFRFGRDRAGNLETLRSLGRELGFEVQATELFVIDDEVVSSSRIRRAVADGELALATKLLGRPHRLRGVVETGDGRGRQLGFPTANLGDVVEMLPPHGVYAVRVQGLDRAVAGVLNIGVRPTFGPSAVSVEVHLLDYQGELVGATLGLDLVARLREEQRFPSVEHLKQQIDRDIVLARQHLSPETASE